MCLTIINNSIIYLQYNRLHIIHCSFGRMQRYIKIVEINIRFKMVNFSTVDNYFRRSSVAENRSGERYFHFLLIMNCSSYEFDNNILLLILVFFVIPANIHKRRKQRKESQIANRERLFLQTSIRARMFSPSSWVKNVREFVKQVEEYRQEEAKKNIGDCDGKVRKENKNKFRLLLNKEELDNMTIIHRDLIEKTSRLVDTAKKSRFRGFFSPRKLRNRINFGHFSQIACSPDIITARAWSPWNMAPQTNRIPIAFSPIEYNAAQNSAKLHKPTWNIAVNSDIVLSNIKHKCKLKKLKSVLEKYQNMKNKKGFTIDDGSIWNQQKVESDFTF